MQVRRQASSHAAVQGISDEGVSDCLQMHPNLMRTTGGDRDVSERDTAQRLRPGHDGDRVPGTSRPDRHPLPVVRIAPDGSLDPLALLEEPPHQRNIALFHFTLAELACQFAMSAVVLGDDHESGGPLVQAVHDAGTSLAGESAEVLHV